MKRPHPFIFHLLLLYFLVFGGTQVATAQTDNAYVYYYYIINPQTTDDLVKGYEFYENRKNTFLQEGDTLAAINDMRMVAIAQYDLGFLFESEQTGVEVLALLDRMKQDSIVLDARKSIYNRLGNIYRQYGDFETAIQYYDLALELTKTTKDSATFINNKANLFREMQKLETAVRLYETSYAIALKQSDTTIIARSLSNLGYTRSMINHPLALENLMEALWLREKISDLKGIFSSYDQLTEYYTTLNDLEKAGYYAAKAYEQARLINSMIYIKRALAIKLSLSSDPEIKRYVAINDSIEKASLIQQNKYRAVKYDIDKERERVILIGVEKDRQQRLTLLYQIIGLLIVLLSAAVYYLLKSRHKKEKLREIYRTETRISKKVHDEVANEVYHVMTKLQSDANSRDEILDDLDHIYAKTRDISKENSALDVAEDFDVLLNDLLLSYKNEQVNIITRNISETRWNDYSEIVKTTIYRVLQELMTNMKKHSKATLAIVSVSQTGKKLHIEYKDNGVGGKINFKNGLQNAESRIFSINGSITFDSEKDKGFSVSITI